MKGHHVNVSVFCLLLHFRFKPGKSLKNSKRNKVGLSVSHSGAVKRKIVPHFPEEISAARVNYNKIGNNLVLLSLRQQNTN